MKHNLLLVTNNFEKYVDVDSQLLFGNYNSTKKPIVSIVIPTYNRGLELEESISSAVEQIGIDFCYEIIIVNNNSSIEHTNVTLDYIKKIRKCNIEIRYYQNDKNIGMFGNWNRCVELARGEWVAFLHDDDLLDEHFLSSAIEEIEKNSKIDGLCSNVKYFGKGFNEPIKKKVRFRYFRSTIKNLFFKKMIEIKPLDSIVLNLNPYGEPSCGLILNRDKIIKLGGFDDSIDGVSDWFFLFKYNYSYRIFKPNFITGYYRWEINQSMKLNTIHDFFKGFEIMRKFGSEQSLVGKILYKKFRHEQHIMRVDEILELIEAGGGNKYTFDYITSYKEKKNSFFLYKLIVKTYQRLKLLSKISLF